jgi:hypothetical protein
LNVENIFEARIFRVRPVDEGDALRTAFHPAVHAPVPEVDARAGHGVRALRVNQDLIHERVFVHFRGAVQERRPIAGVLRNIEHVRGEQIRCLPHFFTDYRALFKKFKKIVRHEITSFFFYLFAILVIPIYKRHAIF